LERIGNLINCLTNNEDHRQELWVYYLEGNTEDSIVDHLQKIVHECSHDINVKYAIWQLITNPLPDCYTKILQQNFSEFEQSIIFSLMLGLSVEQMSKYWDVPVIRLNQAVATIRYNPIWLKLNLVKK